jgi:hypothetical protein
MITDTSKAVDSVEIDIDDDPIPSIDLAEGLQSL